MKKLKGKVKIASRPDSLPPPISLLPSALFPPIPELNDLETVTDILTGLKRLDGSDLVTKDQAIILSNLTFNDGEEILTLDDEYFLYEVVNMLFVVGYEATLEYLSTDWEKAFGGDVSDKNSIRKRMLFYSPLLKEARDKFDIDLDIYRNTIEVGKGVVSCKRCGSDETISLEKQTRSADEPTTIRVTCLQCDYKWRAQ